MSTGPLLSVIIPLYNVELYIEDAIQSLLEQKFDDFEIIVVNDGSTDGSARVVEEIMESENRIRLYHQDNQGLAATRNRGLDMADGKYIYFLDADDMLKQNVLETIMERIQTSNSEMVYFPGQFIDKDGGTFSDKPNIHCVELTTPIRGEELFVRLNKSGCYSPNVQKYIYRKDFLINSNLRFEDGFSHEDEAFSIKALCLAERSVSFKEALMYKRLRPDSIMSTEKALHNVQGWLQAATSITLFAESSEINEEARYIIREKAMSLILTSRKIARKINREEKTNISIFDHISSDIPGKFGLRFKLSLKYDRLFGIMTMLTSK